MMKWLGVLVLAAVPAMGGVRSAAAMDVTGTWMIAADVSGVSVAETCTLAQAAGKVTGSCDTSTGKYDVTGSVADDGTVVLVHGGEYEGSKLTMTYTGKQGSDGMITGTLDVDPFAVTGSFSAKKGAAAAAK